MIARALDSEEGGREGADLPVLSAADLTEELSRGSVECLVGLRVVFIGELNCGLDRASFECLLRHGGAQVEMAVTEETQVVAFGANGQFSARYNNPDVVYQVLARRFPDVCVIDADLLLLAIRRSGAPADSGS